MLEFSLRSNINNENDKKESKRTAALPYTIPPHYPDADLMDNTPNKILNDSNDKMFNNTDFEADQGPF